MKTLIIIITFLIPIFCGITHKVELDFLFGVGIILQLFWSTVLLMHIISNEGIFSFD
jgi:hypothetical protein